MVELSTITEFLQNGNPAVLGVTAAVAAESALYLAGRTHGYFGTADTTTTELQRQVDEAPQALHDEDLLYGLRHPIKAGIYTGRKARLRKRYQEEYLDGDDIYDL